MIEITMKIDGMRCGMCESHVNDAIRRAFPVKKLRSSHKKGLTVLRTEQDISDEALRAALAPTGYRIVSIERSAFR